MLVILLCVVVFFGVFALLSGICIAIEKFEAYVKFKTERSIRHLNYKPKRYGARNYYKPMGL